MTEPSRLLLRALLSIALCALLALSRLAYARVGVPVLVPAHPQAGQLVSVAIFAGGCDAFTDYPPTQVTRDGRDIRLVVSAISTVDPYCINPSGTYQFPISAFGTGTYRLRIDRVFAEGDGLTTETLGVISFDVAAAASVPTLGRGAVLLLMVLIPVMTIYGARRTVTATPADPAIRCRRRRENVVRAAH